ncbi:MAG: DUF4240 domain-containing protein [Haliscomenobacter sp.]|jgi:hypothetical protein|nr:DUF4240 domain-containing protein [Haliscomenobacter sp.]MBV6429320.1 hypothetical protein [Haliscomenobacter sp.]
MTGIYKIKLADLDARMLQELQNQYAHAEVELRVNTQEHWTEEEEDWFWNTIDRLDWKQEGNEDAVIRPVVNYLASQPFRNILLFADILSEKLYTLDAQVFAENMGEHSFREGYYFSVDDFLYARCCVVANGRIAYQNVLDDPEEMPDNQTFGALLRVAPEAYHQKTGQRLQYQPAYDVETFSNEKGWMGTEEE